MNALFNRLPRLFGGRIVGQLYYGSLCKVAYNAKLQSAKVLFFGGEIDCLNEKALMQEMEKVISRYQNRANN